MLGFYFLWWWNGLERAANKKTWKEHKNWIRVNSRPEKFLVTFGMLNAWNNRGTISQIFFIAFLLSWELLWNWIRGILWNLRGKLVESFLEKLRWKLWKLSRLTGMTQWLINVSSRKLTTPDSTLANIFLGHNNPPAISWKNVSRACKSFALQALTLQPISAPSPFGTTLRSTTARNQFVVSSYLWIMTDIRDERRRKKGNSPRGGGNRRICRFVNWTWQNFHVSRSLTSRSRNENLFRQSIYHETAPELIIAFVCRFAGSIWMDAVIVSIDFSHLAWITHHDSIFSSSLPVPSVDKWSVM